MNARRSHLGPVALGRLELASNLVLAPLHRYTHRPMRLLCRQAGAALAHTEMATPEAVLAGDLRAGGDVDPADRPLGVQLLPGDPQALEEAVAMLAGRDRADLVDLNLACPSRRVVASGRGGAMLDRPETVARLVEAAVAADGGMPVTVKCRAGRRAGGDAAQGALATAIAAVEAGAAGVTVHGRTVTQGYAGAADWDIIRRWAEALSVPVFGSGDLRSPEAVLEMLQETRCAGASIARGAIGAPWIFRQVRQLDETGTHSPPTTEERRAAMRTHLEGLVATFGPRRGLGLFRRVGRAYLSGIANASAARQAVQKLARPEDLEPLLDRYLPSDQSS